MHANRAEAGVIKTVHRSSTSGADQRIPATNGLRVNREQVIESVLWLSAATFILAIFLITLFIFAKGLPLLAKAGPFHFLLSTRWNPTAGYFGIGSMVVGTILVTLGAMLWAVPLSLLTAVFMAEIAPPNIGRLMGSLIELLAGIPSVVYGFFGLIVIVPLIRNYLGGNGLSVLAGAIILGIMILPTIISISRDALQAVPDDYKTGSLALGASRYQTIGRVMIPAARSGIITSIVLGMGRAFGETMAVVMVTGNAAIIPDGFLSPVRTMTSNIVLEMGYAAGDHQAALFATGAVLFVMIVILNLVVQMAVKAGMHNEEA